MKSRGGGSERVTESKAPGERPVSTIPLKYLLRISHYLRPYWKLAACAMVLTILSSAAALLTPWPLMIVVDHVLGGRPLPRALASMLGPAAGSRTHLLLLAVIGSLVVALIINCLHVVSNYVNTKMDQYVTLDLRSSLFLHAQRLSLAFHDRRRSGMLIYLINSQGDAPSALFLTIPTLVESALTLIGMFWISFRMDWQLALVSLAVVPFLYYSVGYYATHIQDRIQRVRNQEAESLAVIHESLSMMRVIVAFGREEHEHRRFREQTANAVAEPVKATV